MPSSTRLNPDKAMTAAGAPLLGSVRPVPKGTGVAVRNGVTVGIGVGVLVVLGLLVGVAVAVVVGVGVGAAVLALQIVPGGMSQASLAAAKLMPNVPSAVLVVVVAKNVAPASTVSVSPAGLVPVPGPNVCVAAGFEALLMFIAVVIDIGAQVTAGGPVMSARSTVKLVTEDPSAETVN